MSDFGLDLVFTAGLAAIAWIFWMVVRGDD